MNFLDKIIYSTDINDLISLVQNKNVVAIIDDNVEQLYGHLFPFKKIIIQANENYKNLNTVEHIVSQLLNFNASRDCFLLGIGGGITTDITGFIGSTYKRGVNYGLIPTTLLSQIDASIGGKTGVNCANIKNAIGTFATPTFIYVNPSFLSTLNKKEYMCGAYELLKIFIISDSDKYQKSICLLKNEEAINFDLIKAAIKYKCNIVDKDFNEQNYRRILNLGHTYGHALESQSNWTLSHGEAVATGIVMAAKVGVELGITPMSLLSQIMSDFQSIGHSSLDIANSSSLIEYIQNDKKREGNNVSFVIPIEIGEVKLVSVPINKLKEIQ